MPNPITFDSSTLHAAGSPLLAKMAISKISEELMHSPQAREHFVKDPTGYVTSKYGHAPSAAEAAYFANLAHLVADGVCCGGCGCGSSGIGTVVDPARVGGG